MQCHNLEKKVDIECSHYISNLMKFKMVNFRDWLRQFYLNECFHRPLAW